MLREIRVRKRAHRSERKELLWEKFSSNEVIMASEGGVDYVDDIEQQKQEVSRGAYSLRLMTAAGVFLLYSYLVMNEGAVRASTRAQPQEGAAFSQELLLAAAVCEVVFGLLGILLGAALLMFGMGSKMVTWSWMAVALVFGWFTFGVFVLAANIFGIVNTDPSAIPEGFSFGQFRTLQVMGLLGAIVWCFALQGGQFMVGNVIASIQANGQTKGAGYAKARLIMWSVNAAVSGIVFLIGGSVTLAAVGPGPFSEPVARPPIVMIYPEMTIAASLLHLLFGVFGIYVAVSRKMFKGIAGFAGLALVVSFSMLAWGQAWNFPAEVVPVAGRVEPTTLLAGLSLMVIGNVAYSASELEKDVAMEG